jgi:hypothetical protein
MECYEAMLKVSEQFVVLQVQAPLSALSDEI